MGKQVHNIYLTFLSSLNTKYDFNREYLLKTIKGDIVPSEYAEVIHTAESSFKHLLFHSRQSNSLFNLEKIFFFETPEIDKALGTSCTTTKKEFVKQMKSFISGANINIDWDSTVQYINCCNVDDIESIKRSIVDMVQAIQAFAKEHSYNMDDIVLHVDMSGGPRTASMMLLAVLRIIEYLGIHIGTILYANVNDGDENNNVIVYDALSVYQLFDFIAGVSEFDQYGSAKVLEKSFKDQIEDNEIIKELLFVMNNFSDAISLSSRGLFKKSMERLSPALQSISSIDCNDDFNLNLLKLISAKLSDTYKYTINNNDDDLGYIEWCLKHGYLQQALTLFTEYVPRYICYNMLMINKEEYQDAVVIDKAKATLSAVRKGISLFKQKCKGEVNPEFEKYMETVLNTKEGALQIINDKDNEDMTDRDLAMSVLSFFNNQKEKYYIPEHPSEILKNIISTFASEVNKDINKKISDLKLNKRIEDIPNEIKKYFEEKVQLTIDKINNISVVNNFYLKEDKRQLAIELIKGIEYIYMSLANLLDMEKCPNYFKQSFIKIFKESKYLERYKKDINVNDKTLEIMIQSELDKKELNDIRKQICKYFANSLDTTSFNDFFESVLIEQLDYIYMAKEYLAIKKKNFENNKPTYIYNAPGVVLCYKKELDIVNFFKCIRYYFEIKQSRNDTNHANIELKGEFKTAKELKRAMECCLQLLRSFPLKSNS